MMTGLWFRVGVALAVVLTAAVLLVRVQPQGDSALHLLLAPAEECPDLCLLGLRPGVMTVGQVMERLQNHAWVNELRLSASGAGYGEIRWQWSGQQPDLIDAMQPGRVTFYWEEAAEVDYDLQDALIETVSVYTHARIYLVQQWFGRPDNGTAAFRPDESLGYAAAYNARNGIIDISTVLACPAHLLAYWDARAKITLSIGRSNGTFVPPADAVRMC